MHVCSENNYEISLILTYEGSESTCTCYVPSLVHQFLLRSEVISSADVVRLTATTS
jgi:hypothetical protein